MAKGEIFNARVERIAAGGAGIARLNGKSIFIELTAPGDFVRGRIKKDNKTWAEAEILSVLEPSPLRVEPVCALYGACGGCSLQHMGYDAQIDAKTAILRDAFIRIGSINPPEIRIRRSAPFEYRNRVRFHCENSGKTRVKPHIGFKERKSSRLVAVEDCPIAESGIRKALKEGKIPPSVLRQPPDKDSFTVFSSGDTFLCEGGSEQGRVAVLGRELAMDVRAFFQANIAMLELLITDLIPLAAAADKTKPLADIYCGIGTFASFLEGFPGNSGFPGNPRFPEVDLVEENKKTLAIARENVREKNINYYALSDTEWVKDTLLNRRDRSWGFMILDPPRGGLSGPLREFLAQNGSELLAYVSCDPATLARDSVVLLKGGYNLKELTLYDFYPQTAHIESLAFFSRAPGGT